MTRRAIRIFRAVYWSYVVLGAAVLVAILNAAPFRIGEGRIHEFAAYDFTWWIVGTVSAVLLLPIGPIVVVEWAKAAGFDRERIRSAVREALEHKNIPVIVDIDTHIPVLVQGPVEVGVKLDTSVDIDEKVEIDASIPVSIQLPLDTEVHTSVFGLGNIKVPIRATIPLNITIPLHTSVGVRANRLPIHLDEKARVALPALDVPIKTRLETRVDLLKTLESAERARK